MIKQICEICKKKFLAPLSEIRRGGGKYCSRKCYYKKVKGNGNPFYGKKHLIETIKKMRQAKLGSKNYWFGRKHSKKTKLKMAQSMKGIKRSEISKKRISDSRKGSKHCRWKGGIGYISVYSPKHPFAIKNRVLEHRLIAEKYLGRYLTKKEVIHHIDENCRNNIISNLYLFSSNSKHVTYHHLLKNNPHLKITKTNLY